SDQGGAGARRSVGDRAHIRDEKRRVDGFRAWLRERGRQISEGERDGRGLGEEPGGAVDVSASDAEDEVDPGSAHIGAGKHLGWEDIAVCALDDARAQLLLKVGIVAYGEDAESIGHGSPSPSLPHFRVVVPAKQGGARYAMSYVILRCYSNT